MSQIQGAIAAGHEKTAEAARLILQDGGNAFDAVIASLLTACVTEPVLTSLGGGGFLLAKMYSGEEILYDFFVQTPLQKKRDAATNFFPISADFGTAQQEFYIGPASVATPGTVKGLFAIHKDLCSIPLNRLAEPAVELARDGFKINSFQSGILDIVKPVYFSTNEARRIFRSRNKNRTLIQENEMLKQPELADFIENLAQMGETLFYEGEIAGAVERLCLEKGGHLTSGDFKKYQVYKREPLQVSYRNSSILMNPPPASGGLLIAFALKLLEPVNLGQYQFGSSLYLNLLSHIHKYTEKARIDTYDERPDSDLKEKILNPEYLDLYLKEIKSKAEFNRGTTHISIIDSKGNMAALTTSNGEGSGLIIPGTGVMLNNMLGEEDLHPRGFHKWLPDQRMTSMMAPGILKLKNGTSIVFGSGGSKRIRTALLQLLVNLIDFRMPLDQAINSPRIHYEDGLLNIENGFSDAELSSLLKRYPNHKIWKNKSLFFGGINAVCHAPAGYSGFGDPRRGGVSVILN